MKTEGLSVIYETKENLYYHLSILDSPGEETPLLIQNIREKEKGDEKKDSYINQLIFEEYYRDKLITEFYIRQFILQKSNLIILVVGSMTLSEQKLYSKVKSELSTLQENNVYLKKLLVVVHNLHNFYKIDDVNDYIENTLKKLYNVDLEEMQMHDPYNKIYGFDKFYLEKDNENIIHLLFINDYCSYSEYYNKNTIWFIRQLINEIASMQKFDILEESREFLYKISGDILEKKLSKDDIEIILDKETGTERLIAKNHNEIKLNKLIVDELGMIKNDINKTKYSYYIDTLKSKFVVNIELPGGGLINELKIKPMQSYYSFRFEGEQKGELMPKYKNSDDKEEKDQNYEELDKDNMTSIILPKNLRQKHPFHIGFKISFQVMQIKYDSNGPKYTVEDTNKGVIIYIFDIILNNILRE